MFESVAAHCFWGFSGLYWSAFLSGWLVLGVKYFFEEATWPSWQKSLWMCIWLWPELQFKKKLEKGHKGRSNTPEREIAPFARYINSTFQVLYAKDKKLWSIIVLMK